MLPDAERVALLGEVSEQLVNLLLPGGEGGVDQAAVQQAGPPGGRGQQPQQHSRLQTRHTLVRVFLTSSIYKNAMFKN